LWELFVFGKKVEKRVGRMIRILLLASAMAAALAAPNHCQPGRNDYFGNYLECLKTQLTKKYEVAEKYYRNEINNAYSTCFYKTADDAQGNDRSKPKCVLTVPDYTRDLDDREGPLRGCRTCIIVARQIKKAFLESTDAELSCLQEETSGALQKEISSCVEPKLRSQFPFRFPELPSLDEGMKDFREDAVKHTSRVLNMLAGVDNCGDPSSDRYQNSRRAQATGQCLKDAMNRKDEFVCWAVNGCKKATAKGACLSSGQFDAAGKATCECLDEKQKLIKNKLDSIHRDLVALFQDRSTNNAAKVDQCYNIIMNGANTGANNWIDVADSALNECAKKHRAADEQPKLSLQQSLRSACMLASGSNGADIGTIFKFLNHFLEAITNRVGRFCNESCLKNY
jgi:hypothetical protein